MVAFKGICHPNLYDLMGHMTTRHYVAMFDYGSYHFLHALFGWSGDSAKVHQGGWADVRHVLEYRAAEAFLQP